MYSKSNYTILFFTCIVYNNNNKNINYNYDENLIDKCDHNNYNIKNNNNNNNNEK